MFRASKQPNNQQKLRYHQWTSVTPIHPHCPKFRRNNIMVGVDFGNFNELYGFSDEKLVLVMKQITVTK
ncbi:MAG: hypothetical protein Q8L68_06490 [Methylococcales bacterium]|nr:hypothetical protein [Methylococcales bacterium]